MKTVIWSFVTSLQTFTQKLAHSKTNK